MPNREISILGKITLIPETDINLPDLPDTGALIVSGDLKNLRRFLCPICLSQEEVVNEASVGPTRISFCRLYPEKSHTMNGFSCDVPLDSSYCLRAAVYDSAEVMFDGRFLDKYLYRNLS